MTAARPIDTFRTLLDGAIDHAGVGHGPRSAQCLSWWCLDFAESVLGDVLPAFFSAFTTQTALVFHTGVSYLGLITTLVPLGALAGSLGAVVNQHRFTLVTAVGIIVIVLGTTM